MSNSWGQQKRYHEKWNLYKKREALSIKVMSIAKSSYFHLVAEKFGLSIVHYDETRNSPRLFLTVITMEIWNLQKKTEALSIKVMSIATNSYFHLVAKKFGLSIVHYDETRNSHRLFLTVITDAGLYASSFFSQLCVSTSCRRDNNTLALPHFSLIFLLIICVQATDNMATMVKTSLLCYVPSRMTNRITQ